MSVYRFTMAYFIYIHLMSPLLSTRKISSEKDETADLEKDEENKLEVQIKAKEEVRCRVEVLLDRTLFSLSWPDNFKSPATGCFVHGIQIHKDALILKMTQPSPSLTASVHGLKCKKKLKLKC